MVTTFTYKSGLVRIDARNFELSLQYTRTQTQNPQTGPITIHCAAASAQSNQTSHIELTYQFLLYTSNKFLL